MTNKTIPHESEYTPNEMMIISAARALGGVRTVFVGVGLPNIACNLARYTVAPDLELIYEAGVYGARAARLPVGRVCRGRSSAARGPPSCLSRSAIQRW